MAVKKFYAVRNGRTTGILTSWDECKKSITGFKGAEYKGFMTLEDAKAYLGEESANPFTSPADLPENTAVAYVDGSYNIKTREFGFGAVIFHDGMARTFSRGYNDEELAEMRNVAGEIMGSMFAMHYCKEHGIKNLQIFYDYEGIAKWCRGEWKVNKPGTIAYRDYYNSMKEFVNVSFVKVKGHSGDKYNDMADSLAKKAVGIE